LGVEGTKRGLELNEKKRSGLITSL
jgi:hypothetical protein